MSQTDTRWQDEDDEDGTCATCNGSGGGDYGGIYCRDCGGRGYVRTVIRDNYDGPDRSLE